MIIHGLSQLSLQGAVNINGQYIQNQTGSLNQVSTYIEYGQTLYEYPHIVTFTAVASEAISGPTPVYINGSSGSYPTIAIATSVSGGNAANGITVDSASLNTLIDVAVVGAIVKTDTSTYTNGQTLYLAPSGGFTTTQISGSEDIDQTVALVLVGGSADSGSIAIIPASGGGGGTGKGFPFTGSGEISGSLKIDGYSASLSGTSSFESIGDSVFSGSLTVSGSSLFFGGVELANVSSSTTGSWRFVNTGSNLSLQYYDTLNGAWTTDTIFYGNPLSGSTPGEFSASYAFTASYVENMLGTASFATSSISASLAETASYVATASWANNAVTASYIAGNVESASYSNTASFASTLNPLATASYALTASYVVNSISSSYASTASYVVNSISSSHSETASLADLATTASYVNITGSGIFVNYNGSQIQITSSTPSNLYGKEIHVDVTSGTDTGNGTLLQPIKTIGGGLSSTTSGDTLFIHSGTYTGSSTINTTNLSIIGFDNGKGTTVVADTFDVTAASGTTVIKGIQFNNLNIIGNGTVILEDLTISGSFSKSGTGPLTAYNCDMGQGNGVTITGTGVTAFVGGTYTDLVVLNDLANVQVYDSTYVKGVDVQSGSLTIKDSNVYSVTSGSAAIKTYPSTSIELFNTKVYAPGTNNAEIIDISGSLGYADLIFNKVQSNEGTSLNKTTYFQNIGGITAGGGGGATVDVTGSAPTGENPSGSLWWNETDGNLYVQVTKPTGSAWVPAVNTVAGGAGGATITSTFTAVTSSTISHNLNTTSPIIQVYSASKQFIPQDIEIVDANTTKLTFNDFTTGEVVISTGITNEFNNLTGGTTVTKAFSGVSTVTFQHNLNTQTPFVQVYDSASNQIIPSYVSASSTSTVNVGFTDTTTGTIIVSTGVTNNNPTAVSASYAETASYTTMIEQGTWTPVINQNGISVNTINSARYTKIGKMVHVQTDFSMQGTYTGPDAIAVISGLPYTVESGGFTPASVYTNAYSFTFGDIGMYTVENTKTLQWWYMGVNAGDLYTPMNVSGLVSPGFVSINVTYYTSE